MRCYICDIILDNIVLDGRDKKVLPCRECIRIIQENYEALCRKAGRKKDVFDSYLDTGEVELTEDLPIEEIQELEQEIGKEHQSWLKLEQFD